MTNLVIRIEHENGVISTRTVAAPLDESRPRLTLELPAGFKSFTVNATNEEARVHDMSV